MSDKSISMSDKSISMSCSGRKIDLLSHFWCHPRVLQYKCLPRLIESKPFYVIAMTTEEGLTEYAVDSPLLIQIHGVVHMESEDNLKEREMPHTHLYHALLPVIFVIVWVLDTRILKLSTFLDEIIPFSVRAAFFAVFSCIAIILMGLSHRTLFDNGPPTTLKTDGILAYTRNPMYLGILCMYVAFITLSVSLISVVLFIVVVYVYMKMVNYEENILEEMFNEEYEKYKQNVPKWIPLF